MVFECDTYEDVRGWYQTLLVSTDVRGWMSLLVNPVNLPHLVIWPQSYAWLLSCVEMWTWQVAAFIHHECLLAQMLVDMVGVDDLVSFR